MSNKTSVTKSVGNMTTDAPDWLKSGNAGSENVSIADMVIPRIGVLQALSPQIKKSDPAHIVGAEQGQLFNTVTGELYGDTVTFIPVMFRKEYLLWKTRAAGGGFGGAYPDQKLAQLALDQQKDAGNFEIVETHQHFCLLIGENRTDEIVLSLSKSKLKTSRALNTLVQMSGFDRFAKAYTLKSVESSSDKGDFWSVKVSQAGFVRKELYDRAKELYEMIKSGAADVDRRDMSEDNGSQPDSAEL